MSLLLDDDELDRKVREKVEEEEKIIEKKTEEKKSTPQKRKHSPGVPNLAVKQSKQSKQFKQVVKAVTKRKRDRTSRRGRSTKGVQIGLLTENPKLALTDMNPALINSNGINSGLAEENVFGFYNQVP